MIDYIRLHSHTKSNELENLINDSSKLHQIKAVHDVKSHNTDYPYRATFKGLEFKCTAKQASVYGSIHKYYNIVNGISNNNSNDFGINEINKSIKNLLFEFPFLEKFHVVGLEFGFNINLNSIDLSIPPEELIKKRVAHYKWVDPGIVETFKGKGYLKRFRKENYHIKIYDKSKQFNLSDPILRIELKVLNMKDLDGLKIHSLRDLGKKEVLKYLFFKFKKRLGQVLIHDELQYKKKDMNITEFFLYQNPKFWEHFASSSTKSRYFKKAQELFQEMGILETKKLLTRAIDEKFKNLMIENNGTNSTDTVSRIPTKNLNL
jgi:hypothetical protein